MKIKELRIRRFFSLSNILFIAVLLWVLIQQGPIWYQNYQARGTQAEVVTVRSLQGEAIALPLPERHLVVFWATWCAPCTVELRRIQNLIDREAVRPDQILAISTGESESVVAEAVRSREYTFPVAIDASHQAAHFYQIRGTPTVALVDEMGVIQWKATGLSPTLGYRVASFLRGP